MDAYSLGKATGVVFGLLLGVLIVVVLTRFANKNRKLKTDYDERQEIARGKGFKVAFYSMVGYSVINLILALADLPLPMEPAVQAFSYLAIGVMVDIIYCIWNDCYWGMNNNKKKYIIFMLAAGLLNLIVPIRAALADTLVVNGALSTPGINLMCSVILLATAVITTAKAIRESKSSDMEEE